MVVPPEEGRSLQNRLGAERLVSVGLLSSPLSFDSGLGRVCYDLALFWCAVTHLVF